MAESTAHSTELQTAGGFQIEIYPDVLTVTEARSKAAWLGTYLIYAAPTHNRSHRKNARFHESLTLGEYPEN
jgi:hypothetical protein